MTGWSRTGIRAKLLGQRFSSRVRRFAAERFTMAHPRLIVVWRSANHYGGSIAFLLHPRYRRLANVVYKRERVSARFSGANVDVCPGCVEPAQPGRGVDNFARFQHLKTHLLAFSVIRRQQSYLKAARSHSV